MKLSKDETKWLWGFTLAILAITTIPYLLGFWLQGGLWRFTGFFMGVEDGNSYIAKMSIGTYGGWLFRTPYTAYPQNGFLAFLPYLLAGKLAAGSGLHDQLVALFQGFRWLGAAVMVLATYQFSALFIAEPRWRKWATALSTLGGGLGWLAFVGLQGIWDGRIPLEIYSPESFGFLSLYTLPHLAVARGLLLLGLVSYWRNFSSPSRLTTTIFPGFLWLVIALMQPLTILVGWMVLAVDLAIRFLAKRRHWIKSQNWNSGLFIMAGMIILPAPVVAYTVLSFLNDPFLQYWSQQNLILSPPPVDYFMAYGLLIPFLILGIKRIIHAQRVEGLVLMGWIGLLPFLAYFPYNLQRRLPEGIWPVLVVVSILGLSALAGRTRRIGLGLVSSSFLTTFILIAGTISSILPLREPIYRSAEEVQAFLAIPARGEDYPVVLASYDTSNALPAWSPARTLIGHGPESIHLATIQPQVERFFNSETGDADRLDLIEKFHVRYLIWGPAERKLGSWQPANLKRLTVIFQNSSYQVFEVTR